MTNIPEEKILEFCKAEEGWFWNLDPGRAIHLQTGFLDYGKEKPFEGFDREDDEKSLSSWFKHFSLTKPQVYEDGKWYSAKLKSEAGLPGLSKSMFLFVEAEKGFKTVDKFGVSILSEKRLTNIRRIPEELWSD